MTDSQAARAAHSPLRVLVFSGSLRADSLNTKLARLAARYATEHGASVDFASLREFDAPGYDGDAETRDGIPAGPQELQRRLLQSDAFMISSPEYNGSMPGVLKNVVDWTSRFRPQPFHARHGLLMSASPSLVGGNRGLWSLRVPFEHLGARIFPDMFSLASAHKMFDGENLTDAALQERFAGNVRAFLDLAESAKNYPCMKKAWVEFLGEPSSQSVGRIEAP